MSEKSIKLYANLKIGLSDLMKLVECSVEPSLRDLLSIIKNSEIPIEIWGQLLRCHYLQEYIDEVGKHPFKNDGDIEYLELYWSLDKTSDEMGGDCSWWGFHGVGKEGVIPQDMIDNGYGADFPKDWRQGYAIEMTPLYDLADYPIKIARQICITDFGRGVKDPDQYIPVRPSITVLEFFYYVFWELSYFGSPDERDAQTAELSSRVQSFKDELASGNVRVIDNEEATEKLKKYLKDGKKSAEDKSGDK